MVCDQPFCVSYLDQFIQKLSAMSKIVNRIHGTIIIIVIVTYRGSVLPLKLKVCNSLILNDSPWTKSVKVSDRNMEHFYLRPQYPSEESQISLSWSGESITYVI